MTNSLLQKGGKIRLEKGMTIHVSLPQKFLHGPMPFSDKTQAVNITIGEIYKKHAITSEDLAPLALEAVSSILHLPKNAINEISKEKMIDFIKSLSINFDEELFDTSIYEGEYQINASVSDGYNGLLVYCTKIDNPSMHCLFHQIVDLE